MTFLRLHPVVEHSWDVVCFFLFSIDFLKFMHFISLHAFCLLNTEAFPFCNVCYRAVLMSRLDIRLNIVFSIVFVQRSAVNSFD